ncbi:early endosome antigen 1-like [Mytilus trossulus]|uniref:early endosome antigen 1-like n=1 Tax=Mytilus trossulus TaxID=6551 RepID=UPI003003FD6D
MAQETHNSHHGNMSNNGSRSDEWDNLKQFENAFQRVRSDLSKHSNEIKRLEEDKSRLSILYENEKENSKRTINALEAKVKQLLNERNIQVEELKRTALKLVEAQKERNKYHESNEKLRNYNSELETRNTSLESKHKELDEQLRKSESELRQLEKDRKELQQKVNETEKKKRDLTLKFQEYLDSNQAYKDQNSKLLIDIGTARKEIKAQNEKSKVAKETYEREKTCNDDVIHKKEDIICILKSDMQSLKDINHAQEKKIAKMKEIEIAKHIQMESQMEDLEKKRKSLVGLQKEKKRLYKARMEGVELDFALFKERVSGSREHFKREEAKNSSSKIKQPASSERLSLRSMNKTLRNKLKRMEAEKQTIEGRLHEAQESLHESENVVQKLKMEEEAFKNFISEERHKESRLKAQYDDVTRELEKNRSEKEEANCRLVNDYMLSVTTKAMNDREEEVYAIFVFKEVEKMEVKSKHCEKRGPKFNIRFVIVALSAF